ncbi:MAG TPA: PIN domain-containing protein [Nitrospirota bacterium]|nr:PIN domain-containing protein [Nitrospirota bacterium]
MTAGVDTGFFFALEEQHPLALKVWEEREIVTSVIVLYEIEKKLLGGRLSRWPTIMADLRLAVSAIPLGEDSARLAARLSHKFGLPGLDSLILATLLDAGVRRVYTTDAHFELYKAKGVEIINLAK